MPPGLVMKRARLKLQKPMKSLPSGYRTQPTITFSDGGSARFQSRRLALPGVRGADKQTLKFSDDFLAFILK